ncbi:hypothetical protein DFH08DRAFT_798647 [Mycena albidolilacea]|uniref:DUF4219 domain-containing protein n=1 Tax=Mycena albidolilacea TaxID=1033008 RepID=A0AAD7ANS4_9AGAR|nr:hypothetical protein DFH08DRAFT_798647 [Mycena albidolilacea]
MADSDRYSFACLGNKNYANDWDIQMEAILVRKGLWDVVQVVVSDTNSDGSAKTLAEMDMEKRTMIAVRDASKMAELQVTSFPALLEALIEAQALVLPCLAYALGIRSTLVQSDLA